jgi:capsular exopolysaccharide synthesis family protein
VLAEQEKKLLAAQDELQKLSPFLGPHHPQITELQQQIANTDAYLHSYRANAGNRMAPEESAQFGAQVKAVLDQAIVQTQERERQLAKSFEQARDEAAQHSGRIVDLQMKEREVARIEKLHDLLCEKIASVDVRQVQAPIHVTVVREPVAEATPVSPQLRLVALACLFIGCATGCAIVYVLDVMDDRFDSPEELQAQLGVPVLAIVRELQSLPADGLDSVQAFVAPDSADAEAFRTLRTAITLNSTGTDRILISSSEPGDGKTTVIVNLAVAFAQAGNRTLLIDADLRKPGLTTLLDLKSHTGLGDILTAGQAVEEIAPKSLCESSQASLQVIPTGRRRSSPAELLGNGRFAELLAWAESHYDQVLVDCPPVLAVSDAQIVGQLVDAAVMVVRPDKNHRRNVVRAVENFHATGCQVIGVVANGVAPDADAYGYGYGYGYGHEEPAAELEEIGPTPVKTPDLVDPADPLVAPFAPAQSMPANVAASASQPDLIRPRRAA